MPLAQNAVRLQEIIALQSALVSLEFNLAGFMGEVVERLQKLTRAAGAVIEMVDGDDMVYRAASGTLAGYVDFRISQAGSLSGLCVRQNEVMVSDDTTCDPRVNAEACRKVGAASMVVVPLVRLGATIGVLKVVAGQPHAFNAEDIQTLQMLAGVMGAALGQQMEIDKRTQLEAQLNFMAQHDQLTGLPNRGLFNDRLDQAIKRLARRPGMVSLLYIDIDHFKKINDSFGHQAGDVLLQAFATRATALLRPTDTLARLGGDEFALVAENLTAAADAEIIATKLVAAMRESVLFENHQLQSTISVGIAITDAATAVPHQLIADADAALYAIKKTGRNAFKLQTVAA